MTRVENYVEWMTKSFFILILADKYNGCVFMKMFFFLNSCFPV